MKQFKLMIRNESVTFKIEPTTKHIEIRMLIKDSNSKCISVSRFNPNKIELINDGNNFIGLKNATCLIRQSSKTIAGKPSFPLYYKTFFNNIGTIINVMRGVT